MGRPRVLLLITLAETGGAQTYVASLLPGLVGEFDVVVAAHGDGPLPAAALTAGARFVPLRHVRRRLHPLRDLLGLLELVRLFRRERPVLVHANSSKAGVLGRIAAVLAGVPARIFTAHGWAFNAARGAAATGYLWIDRLMRPLTTMTICVAESERAAGIAARTCRAERTTVIHNGVDLDRPVRPAGPPGVPATVLSVGRLRPPKDFLTLVRAVAALPPGTVRLQIAGDGPDRAAVAAEVVRLGLGETVELLGERNDVDRLLAGADLFVLSSDSEGLPLSVIEAMAAALPVVATAVGGVPELVRDGDAGVLVPARDPVALARAIAGLVGDASRHARAGEAARLRVERDFSLAACRQAHLELYRALVGRPKRARR